MVEGELALALFGSVCVLLLFGFPVALTLAGTALLFAAVGVIAGHFDASFVAALSGRMFGTSEPTNKSPTDTVCVLIMPLCNCAC